MTLDELDAERARLDVLRAELVRERDAARNDAMRAFVMEYDYSVSWPHPAQFSVERSVTPECRARITAFAAQWGTEPKPFEGGMTYSVLVDADGNHYAEGGGGSVIVDFGSARSSFDPSPLDADILAALRAGSVPISIRRA